MVLPGSIKDAGLPGGPHPDQSQWDALSSRPIVAIPISQGAANKTLLGGACILIGWALRETSGAASNLDFRDSQDTGGMLVASDAIAANGSTKQSVGVAGALCKSGLNLQSSAGNVQGAAWVRF